MKKKIPTKKTKVKKNKKLLKKSTAKAKLKKKKISKSKSVAKKTTKKPKAKLKKTVKKTKVIKVKKKKALKKKKLAKKIKKIPKKKIEKAAPKKRKKRTSKKNVTRNLILNKKVKLVANKKPDLSNIKSNDEDILMQYSEFAERRTQSAVTDKIVRSPILSKKDLVFEKGDQVVYPTHGVGKIIEVQQQELAGIKLQLYVVEFEKDKMILRVPTAKLKSSGMRKLSSKQRMDIALSALKGRARVKRAMWSRRAKEYEDKINSGDPKAIAEVVRDLHRNSNQPEQSYSERQIYESALDRLLSELSAVENVDLSEAMNILESKLKNQANKTNPTEPEEESNTNNKEINLAHNDDNELS